MKKIIFIANNNISDQGLSGGDRIFIEFLKSWNKKLDITFFACEEAIRIALDRGVEDIKIIKTSKRNPYGDNLNFIKFFKHLLIRLFRGLNKIRTNLEIIRQADFVYSVSDFYPDFFPALYSKLLNKKIKWMAGYYLFAPFPFSQQSPYFLKKFWLKGFLYWLMQKPSYFFINHFADFVFVTSEPDVKKFLNSKRDRSKIIVVQGGVDITFSEKYLHSNVVVPAEERKYDACFIGRFHPQKGVLLLPEIWKQVVAKKPKAKLALIGNGELEKSVKEKISKLKIKPNIDFLGFQDGEQKHAIFKQSKIVIHPAIYDSGGMAAAEAMAWKLPGVCFNLESLKTYYPKGMLKTECFNLQQFSDNILQLLRSKSLYNKLSNEAHDLIIKSWDWQKRSRLIYKRVFQHE